MDEELILQQPTDRRLGTGNTLPPGPPGAENDVVDYESNKPKIEKESNRSSTSRSSRRRSPSGSPPRSRRKSPSRGRRSPSPLDNGSRRRRRSPSPPPRRNRFRDYSPDRRRFDGGGRNLRRSPDRRRGGGGGRDFRYRGRSSSRSRSRSISPRRGGGSRWSPKKKPSSPLPINAPPPPQVTQPPTQYSALPPQLYSNDTYAPTAYNQYAVPPPQQAAGFPPQTPADAYGMQAPAPPVFNTAYPPPPVWTANDAYAQQPWLPSSDPNQLPQIAQQQPPVAAPTAIPPPQIVQQPTVNEPAPVPIESTSKHDAAVAQEAENQRDELKRQRSSYLKKTSLLRKELKMLKDQRKDLHSGGGAPPSPTTKGFIDENEKLQNQIQKKLNTIENVIDMLTGIIGEENLERDDEPYASDKSEKEEPTKKHTKEPTLPQQPVSVGGNSERSRKKKRKNSSTSSGSSTRSSSSSSSTSSSSTSTENEVEEEDDDSSPERLKNKAIESMKAKAKEGLKRELKEEKLFDEKKRFNYVFYDPEMHWCQTCDVFPKTAKDYLNHLHSKEHMDRESIETPWHTDTGTDQFPNYENAPTKRTPIRGLTFFVPASAWFCKLCNNWMGDLHCASTHLKSQVHASKYNAFLEKNPHFEVNWLADRQRVLNERKTLPPPQQITSVSTTAAESTPSKKSKKEEKVKKRKKKSSDKKDKKKKRKRSKKRKKTAATTSTSSDSSSSDSEKPNKNKTKPPVVVQGLDNPNPALSIRVAMRKQDLGKADDDTPLVAQHLQVDAAPHPVPPPAVTVPNNSSGVKVDPAALLPNSGRLSKWTETQDNSAKPAVNVPQRPAAEDDKNDDAILQQWNNVQPVISESEKKLLEQLKGKLKNKPHENATTPAGASIRSNNDGNAERRVRDRDRDRDRERERDRDRDRERDRDRNDRDRSDRRRRSRSPVFGGGGGRGRMRRTRSRTRSRSRGRAASPYGRRRRTRSRSRGRRSRSFERRRRYSRSRTRSRTRSSSRNRIEKPIVRHPEFRPRVPEKEKEREKRSTTETKDKKNVEKKSKSSSTSSSTTSGKKLPFIGKMPVFKKQTAGQADGNGADNTMAYVGDNSQQANPAAYMPQRPPAPTAAQIQMAMMEDAYGNAPPFHPDAGMMMDYDELMPDPIQFVNLMGQAPPPPPPPAGGSGVKSAETTEDEAEDILPPGIDVTESDDCVPRPITDGPIPRKGPLPKDLEEALNIIFPGEKKSDDEDAEDAKKAKSTGETQIIVEEPIMQAEDLVKEGIHMVTIEETSMIGMDEASQMSMNEPLVFNKPASAMPTEVVVSTNSSVLTANVPQIVEITSQDAADIDLNAIQPPPPPATATAATTPTTVAPTTPADAVLNGVVTNAPAIEESSSDTKNATEVPDLTPAPADIPMPTPKTCTEDVANIVYDLDDIPQPPPSPTESEKNRRQEELNDLAMLGIDADDMAAQCI